MDKKNACIFYSVLYACDSLSSLIILISLVPSSEQVISNLCQNAENYTFIIWRELGCYGIQNLNANMRAYIFRVGSNHGHRHVNVSVSLSCFDKIANTIKLYTHRINKHTIALRRFGQLRSISVVLTSCLFSDYPKSPNCNRLPHIKLETLHMQRVALKILVE